MKPNDVILDEGWMIGANWLKNSGYSSSRIYYIKQDVKDSGSGIILEMMRSIKELQ